MMNPLIPGSSSSWQPTPLPPKKPLPQQGKPTPPMLPLPFRGNDTEIPRARSLSGRAFTHLLEGKELPPAAKSILQRAEYLASQFDLFSQEEDGKEVSSEMVLKINTLLQHFRNLQSEHVESISALHVDVQTKIGSELAKLTDKVAFMARDLEAFQHVITIQNSVDQRCDAAALFLKFEGSNTTHSIATYRSLLEDLDKLLSLHNEIRSSASQIHDDALRLAVISSLQESISQIAETLRPYQALCQRIASDGDHEALESLASLIEKGESTATALRQHVLRHYTAVANQSLPNRFVTSIFHAFRHPLTTIQSGLDYIEEKAPIPAHSPLVLMRQKEGQIEQELRYITNSLSNLRKLKVEVDQRLDQVSAVKDKGKGQRTVADRYADWLRGFADTYHQLAQLQEHLESLPRPEAEELARVTDFIEGVRQQQQALLEMGPRLRTDGFTAELWEALQDEIDDVTDQAVNLYDLLLFRHQINQFDEQADHYMEAVEDQRVVLATGGTDFSVTHDCELLEQIEVLAMLYCRSERENLPREYRQEMHFRLAHEVGALGFGRGEYSDDYRDALEAEVAKATLTMRSHRRTDSEEALRQCAQGVVYADHLLHQMSEAKQRLEQREGQLDTLIHPLISDKSAFNDGRSSLAKEFKRVYEQLQDDLSFITDQMEAIQSHATYRTNHDAVTSYISELSVEEATALGLEGLPESGSNWTVRLREANIERAVKRLEEPEDQPEGWGMKVLRLTLWGLYYSDKIHATAQFVGHAHQYWSTGENPLRPYADLLSHAAFARQAASMSPVDQAKAGLEMNMVEGILKGFIPYTPELAEEHPAIARYLEDRLNISAPISTPALAGGNSPTLALGGPDARNLSPDELNEHMTHFLGQRVHEHYSATGQQIGLESPSRVDLQPPSPFLDWLMGTSDTAIEVREPTPLNPLQIIGADLAAAIRYQQQGHLEGDNPHLEQVQRTVQGVFGTPLPSEWIEEWLFKQDWSEDRLTTFSSWVEQSLNTQASYYMAQQRATAESQPTAQMLPTAIAALPIATETILQTVSEPQPIKSMISVPESTIPPVTEPLSFVTIDEGARRLQHFLEAPLETNDVVLGHIVGHQTTATVNAKVSNKELEGSTHLTTIAYQLQVAKEMLESLKAIPATETATHDISYQATLGDSRAADDIRKNPAYLQEVIRQLEIAAQLDKSLEQSDFEDFRNSLTEQVDKLKPGDTFFLPGGWTGKKGGHGTAWEVTRQSDGLLTIRHYNTGAGLQYNTMVSLSLNERFLHFTELLDVEPSQFTSRAFLHGQRQLRGAFAQTEGGWDADDIYGSLISVLGGRMSTNLYSSDKLKLPQYAGICAMESIMAVIEEKLPTGSAERLFRYWSTLKATTSWFEANRELLTGTPGSEERQRLLDNALKSLSMRAQAVAADGSITAEELAYVRERMDEMRATLVEQEAASAIATSTADQPTTFVVGVDRPPDPNLTGRSSYISSDTSGPLTARSAISLLDWDSWNPEPAKLAEDLSRCLIEVRQIRNSENFLEVERTVREIALKIPLNDKAFWEQIDAKAGLEALSSLTSLSQIFFESFIENRSKREPKPDSQTSEDYLTLAKILSLADLIIHRYPNDFDMQFPSLFQEPIKAMIDPISRWTPPTMRRRSEPHLAHEIQLYNGLPIDVEPQWEREVDSLRQYWHMKPSDALERNDLFGFYWFPAAAFSRSRIIATYEELEEGAEEDYAEKDTHVMTAPKEAGYHDKIIEMLAQWAVRHPQQVEKINRDWPTLRPVEQAAHILAAMDQIPPLQDIFRISYIHNFLINGGLGKFRDEAQRWVKHYTENTIKCDVRKSEQTSKGKRKTEWKLSYPFLGQEILNQYGIYYHDYFPLNVHPADVFINSHKEPLGPVFSEINRFDHYPDSDISGRNDKGLRKRLDPNVSVLLDPLSPQSIAPKAYGREADSDVQHHRALQKALAVTVEELRKLFNLSSVKQLQIPQVIGHLNIDLSKLSEPYFQLFIQHLLTEETLLEQWYLENPSNVEQLAKLCHRALDYAHQTQDITAEIFVVGLSRRLADSYRRMASEAHTDALKGFGPDLFPDARAVLNAILQRPSLLPEQRGLAHMERALSYKDQTDLTPTETAELLLSTVLAKQIGVPKEYSTIELKGLLRNKLRQPIRENMEGPHRDAILTAIAKGIGQGITAQEWTSPGFPYYLSKNSDIQIDVLGGYVDVKGKIVPFDRELLQNRDVTRVFGDKPPEIMIKVPNQSSTPMDTVQVEHQHGDSYLLYILGSSGPRTIYVERKIGETFYELLNENSSCATSDSNSLTFRLSPALTEEKLIWFNKKGEPQIILTDAATGRITHRITVSNDESHIEPMDEQGQPNGLELVDAAAPAIAPFKRFESSHYILGWAREGILEKVDLPRFGLTFHIEEKDGRREAICEGLAGYSLVEGERQHVADLGDYPYYLHLQRTEEDGSRKELVVLARQQLKEHKLGTYHTATEPNQQIDDKGLLVPQRLIEYRLVNGQMIPNASGEADAIEANLYLALIHLQEKNEPATALQAESRYRKVNKMLEDMDRQLLRQRAGLSLESIEILVWMANTKDGHPDALAVRLKAITLLMRNGLYFPSTPISRYDAAIKDKSISDSEREAYSKRRVGILNDLKSLIDNQADLNSTIDNETEETSEIYKSYLQQLNHVDSSLRLKPWEEKLLIKRLPRTQQTKYRLNQLVTQTEGHYPGGTTGRPVPIAFVGPSLISMATSALSLWNFDPSMLNESPEIYPDFPHHINGQLRFSDYYAIAKGECSVEKAIEVIEKGFNLKLPDSLTMSEIQTEMITALKMRIQNPFPSSEDKISQTVRDTGRADKAAAAMLLAVFTAPSLYPSVVEISITIDDIKKIKKELESLEINYNGAWQEEEKIKLWGQITALKAQRTIKQGILYTILATSAMGTLATLVGSSLVGELAHSALVGASAVVVAGSTLLEQAKSAMTPDERSDQLQPEPPRTVAVEDLTLAQCIELRAAPYSTRHTLLQPVIPNEILDQLLVGTSTPEGREVRPETLFSTQGGTSGITEAFAEASDDFTSYATSGKGVRTNYRILDPGKLQDLETEMNENIIILDLGLRDQEETLLRLANKQHEDLQLQTEVLLQRHAGTNKAIVLDELVRSVYKRDKSYIHERNPALSNAEVEQLFTLIQDYLLDATHLTQQQRVLSLLEDLNTSVKAGSSEIVVQEKIRAFVNVDKGAQTIRHYDFHEHPEFLVFEYYTKSLIWQSQIETIGALNEKGMAGTLVELAMGQGKSHVIAPLLAWLNADGRQLATVVMPEPLIESMARDLSDKFGNVFGQRARTLAINRQPITLQRLTLLYDALCEVRDNREVLLWTPSDIQSLFNQWVEFLETSLENSKHDTVGKVASLLESTSKISSLNGAANLASEVLDSIIGASPIHAAFLNIFNLLRESGVITVDEVHKVFDILLAHKFTFGDPQVIHQDISAATGHLFQTLKDPVLAGKIHWDFSPSSTGPAFTDEHYHSVVKPAIIDALIEKGIAPEDKSFQKFFRSLTEDQKLLVRNYLLDASKATSRSDDAEGSSSAVTPFEFVGSLTGEAGQKIRNQLATLKELLGRALPVTAAQAPMVHFGPNEDNTLIIPYRDGDPIINSLHGSVLERILLTTQYYLAEGVHESIVRTEAAQLEMELAVAKEFGMDVDSVLAKIKVLCGDTTDRSISSLTDDDFVAITASVNANPDLQLSLIQKHRYPEIKTYTREIESSAHIFPALSQEGGINAMAGTLPNRATYPDVFQEAKLSDTQAKSLDILRRMSPEKVATLPKSSSRDPAVRVANIYSSAIGTPGCIIDASGRTIGLGNEAMARAMLDHLPDTIKGVVYYDGNTLKVVFRGDSTSRLYDRKLNKNELAVFWDLPHNVGSDIPIGDMMSATMLVSKHTTLVDMMQAAWRMRGLDKGQTINFMVPEEDRLIIVAALKEHLGEDISEGADLTLDQLFRYQLLIQTLHESENNYRAVQEKMKMALAMRLLDIMWDMETPYSKAFEIFQDARSLFVKETPQEPWDMFGAPIHEVPTPTALKQLLENWKANPILQAIKAKPDLYQRFDVDGLISEWQGIVEGPTGPLPPTTSTSEGYGSVVEQTVEAKQQTQQQTQTLQETKQQLRQQVSLDLPSSMTYVRPHIPPIANIFAEKDSIPRSLGLLGSTQEILGLKAPCITANDMVNFSHHHFGTSTSKRIYDDGLLVTLNYMPLYSHMLQYHEPFGKTQKDSTYVQVIQFPDGHFKVKMLDIDDAQDVYQQIKAERQEAKEGIVGRQRDVRIGLYQMQSNDLHMLTGSQGIDLEGPGHREELLRLLVQAKFTAGRLDYTKEELPILRSWLEEIGPTEGFNLFSRILNPLAKLDSRRAFPGSIIAKVFEDMDITTDIEEIPDYDSDIASKALTYSDTATRLSIVLGIPALVIWGATKLSLASALSMLKRRLKGS